MSLRPLVVVLALAACDGAGPGTEDPAEHACEHLSDPGTSVTASEDRADAPAITVSEDPFTVSLPEGARGYVRIEVAAETEAVLFVDLADVVSELWHDDTAETLPTGTPNASCPDDIPEHYDLHLEPGTWTIGLGPAAVEAVWLMLTPAEGHADD